MRKSETDHITYYACIPVRETEDEHKVYSANAANFVGYTDNQFVLSGYLGRTLPLLRRRYGNFRIDVLEYKVETEDELFYRVLEDTDNTWSLTVNDKFEIFGSDNNPELTMYLTSKFLDGEDYFTGMPDDYIGLLWTDHTALKQTSDILRLPEKITKMLELIGDPYLPLIAIMTFTDLWACKDTKIGKSIVHLLRTKWKDKLDDADFEKGLDYFNIYDIWDNTFAMYHYLVNNFTFRSVDRDSDCEEE